MSIRQYLRRTRLAPVLAGLVLLTLAVPPALAETRDFEGPTLGGSDWRLPDQVSPRSGVRSVAAPSTVGNPCPGCTTGKVPYTTFGGTELTLNEFRGKHVQVLLPDTWVDHLDEEEIVGLVESGDRGYELLRDLVGKEPFLTDGLLSLAFVPSTCGLGCGVIGHGRSEFWDGTQDDGSFLAGWADAVAVSTRLGLPDIVILHEMTHNFDVFASHLWYHHDSSHWWTDLLTNYAYAWGIMQPEEPIGHSYVDRLLWFEQLSGWQDALKGHYPTDPSHDWERCVRDDGCEDVTPRRARAALTWKVLQELGTGILPRTLEFLEQETAGQAPPTTPEAKEELWVEALAAGAGGDLSGCLAAMKWHTSPGLVDRMLAQGPPVPLCLDSDADGFTPYVGDCNDADPQVGPQAGEVPGNGVDDDCNGATDEPRITLTKRNSSLPAPPWSVVGDIRDEHFHRFQPQRSSRSILRLCSPPGGFEGLVALVTPPSVRVPSRILIPGSCTQIYAPLDTQSGWELALLPEEAGNGLAEAALFESADWPAPWGNLRVSQLDQRRLALEATVTDPSAWRSASDQVRFELSGFGRLGTAPLTGGRARLEWTAPVDLVAGETLFAFAQPVVAQAPVAPAPAMEVPAGEGLRQVFRPIDIRPCAPGAQIACLLDGRFEVTGVMNDFSTPPKPFPLQVMDFPGGRAESDQAAFFDSFTAGNFEIGVKMVNGCTLPEDHPNRAYWLFLGGLTTADSVVRVEDTATGDVYEWTNPRGNLPQTLGDTRAFECSGGPPAPGACTSGNNRACLLDRFEITGVMKDFATPPTDHALRVMGFPGGRAESTQAAFFDSFNRGNFEVGVKMVNGCGLPPGDPGRAYWLFVGGLTTAQTEVAIRQVSSGQTVRWTNPRGNLPRSTGNTAAFPCE